MTKFVTSEWKKEHKAFVNINLQLLLIWKVLTLFYKYYGRALNNVSYLEKQESLTLEIGTTANNMNLKEMHIE